MIELFKDDHIIIRGCHIRALSPMWWAVRIGQGVIGAALAYTLVFLMAVIGG